MYMYHPFNCVFVAAVATGRAFVSGLLAKEPKKRLTADQALAHPWMTLELPSVDLSFSTPAPAAATAPKPAAPQ
jgi:hypothetical protein